ncbi:hypothetical protein AALO_G00210800 [Alosa alosa]|uniref:Uncharacterized protein n=1 Tax=Alosa alosa TaxID=278164 RepID=A0AAV6G4C1_9TELE|nr:hypothetical protein AALO_G00210800 [Alosa alosa]
MIGMETMGQGRLCQCPYVNLHRSTCSSLLAYHFTPVLQTRADASAIAITEKLCRFTQLDGQADCNRRPTE